MKNCTLLCIHMYTGKGSIGCLQQRPLTVQISFWWGEITKCILKHSILLRAKKSKIEFLFFSQASVRLFCFMLSMLKQWARNMMWYYEKMEGDWCKVFSHNLKLWELALCFQKHFSDLFPLPHPTLPHSLEWSWRERSRGSCYKILSPHILPANGFWWILKFTDNVWQSQTGKERFWMN